MITTDSLQRFADLVVEHGGSGLEMEIRPFGRGALIRVWLPDLRSCQRVSIVCPALGIRVEHWSVHLLSPDDVSGHGYQFVATASTELVEAARAALAHRTGPETLKP